MRAVSSFSPPAADPNRGERFRRITRWQEANESIVRFGRGKPFMVIRPDQRRKANESLAVENLRRAYWRWRMNR